MTHPMGTLFVNIHTQGPHSHILMAEGGGGGRQRFIFYAQKDHNFRICLPQKITTLFSIPKKSLIPFFATQKIPSGFFSRPKQIPASFIDPKRSLWAKISDPKNHSYPPVIKICEWSPWAYTRYDMTVYFMYVVKHSKTPPHGATHCVQ